jgi:LacI family transcriptional regulator
MEKVSPLNLIAKLSGVSKMTVSRALRDGTSVEPELRARIRETARKLGYQPDSRISQVMRAVRKAQPSSYRETLAFIWTHPLSQRTDRSGFFKEEFEGASRRAQQLGYRLDVFRLSDEMPAGNSLSHILQSRGIRGVLIAPLDFAQAPPVLPLDWNQFSCVLLGSSFPAVDLPRVQHDDYDGCVMTLQHLTQLGHQRIGLIMSRSMDEVSGRLIRSAFTSFHPVGSKEAAKLIFTADGYEAKALKKWISQIKPELVVGHFEEAFPTVEQLCRQTSPNLLIVALNWDKNQPDIAGIDQHRALIGEQAVDLLLLRLQGNQVGLDPLAPSIKVPGSWREGASLRAGKPTAKRKSRADI